MHYAIPPSKSARSPRTPVFSSARSSRSPWLRRVRLRPVASILAVVLLLLWLLSAVRGGHRRRHAEVIPPGTPKIVVVTDFDQNYKGKYEKVIAKNREYYTQKHGYALFIANKTDYDLADPPVPASWARVPAMRHAMTAYPHSTWFFYLDQHALVMQPEVELEAHILAPAKLHELMMPDVPVVPPDSVIRTYRNTKPENVEAVFTQDSTGLGATSFIVKRGDWARYFLDAWFDPLYRSYNFQKAERHALEHLVQWHGTVLLKLILIPQRLLNSYTRGEPREMYQDGDFIANLFGCDAPGSGRSCEKEMQPLIQHLETKGYKD